VIIGKLFVMELEKDRHLKVTLNFIFNMEKPKDTYIPTPEILSTRETVDTIAQSWVNLKFLVRIDNPMKQNGELHQYNHSLKL